MRRYFERLLEDFDDEVEEQDDEEIEDTDDTTIPYDPFKNISREEVLEHYGINLDLTDDYEEPCITQCQVEYRQGQHQTTERQLDTTSSSERETTRNITNPPKKSSNKRRRYRTQKKVMTRLSTLNDCRRILPLERLDIGSLLYEYGNEFYIISLFKKDKRKGLIMKQTLNLVNELIFYDFGYIPIYSYNRETMEIENIFLIVFNYNMKPSFRTIGQGIRSSKDFKKKMFRTLNKYGIKDYIYNYNNNLLIYENGEVFEVFDILELGVILDYYSNILGSYCDISSFYMNNVPSPLEYDNRSMNNEIYLTNENLNLYD